MSNTQKKVEHYEVAVIGAGFAGLGAGVRLKMTGSPNFIIFEKAAEIGGTWRDNTYPGCACDIPSFLYSYSFEANPEWTKTFSSQGEILAYMKHCLHKYKIEEHIQYKTEITKSVFEEQLGIWRITDINGNSYTARMVISAAGPFDRPFIPNIAGKDSFEGVAFHSSRWQHDVDLKGKTVAVIGTGASAIQFVPEIAKDVKQLYVCQRTPPWIAPKTEQTYTEKSKATFRKYPWYQRFWREFIYYFLEYRGKAHSGDKKMRAKRKQEALAHLHNSVKDTELRKKLITNQIREFG